MSTLGRPSGFKGEELRRIVDIEPEMVQQRIQVAAASKPFLMDVTDSARGFLQVEGTDFMELGN